MASILNFSNFSFSAEQIRAIKDLVYEDLIVAPELSLFATVYPGIVYDKEVGFIGEGGLVGVAGQGCDPQAQAWNIGTRKITWTPKDWEILIHECAKDLESTAAVYSMRTGVRMYDFTDTDYMALVVDVLSRAIKEFIIRLVWFNDTAAANAVVLQLGTAVLTTQPAVGQPIVGTVYAEVAEGTPSAVHAAIAGSPNTDVWLSDTAATGNVVASTDYYTYAATPKLPVASSAGITPGIDEDFFNIIDGFFKQMEVIVGSSPEQLVTIAENAGATYAAQALTPATVRDTYLPAIIDGADMEVRGGEGFILATQSFYDAYRRSLNGLTLESMYVNLTEGIKTLTFDGIPIVPMKIWDKIIKKYYNNGISLVNPHRAVYTTKAVLAVGVDSLDSFGEIDVWYDKDSRKVKIEAMGKADAKITNPSMFQIAI